MSLCAVCNKELKDQDLVRHHKSYFPEEILVIHRTCHTLIHHTKNPRFESLIPKDGDSYRFYGCYKIIINLDSETISKLEILAAKEDRSRKNFIEYIIKKYVECPINP